MNDLIETDVLVIGAGIAGGVAALQLAEAGIPVTLVTRSSEISSSITYYAQGGIVYKGLNDSSQMLQDDILKAGAEHCNAEAVKILAESGASLVEKILLEKLQVPFDRKSNGQLSVVLEGGHRSARIIHAADATGRAIEEAIYQQLSKHSNITFLTDFTAIDLLTPEHHSSNKLDIYKHSVCVGAYLLDQSNNQVKRCLAKKTILATGGLGRIFLRTTNPPGARGDGLAMAYRAGARVINNEFMQFHPTVFYHEYKPTFLISEAVRGAGARLVDAEGKPFMEKYSPEWKDLAPRDLVAASIHKEIIDKGLSNVFLDVASYIPADEIENEFPNIQEKCRENGLDMRRDLIPVVPAAHYSCGGVWVDEWGQTTINNLYAVGEVSCTGVHGANRLASTSLLEGLVWGVRSSQKIQETIVKTSLFKADHIPVWKEGNHDMPDPALIQQDMSSIKHIMWNYVGLVRNNHRLQRALRELRNLENEIERFYRVTRLTDDLLGLRNAVRAASIVTMAAWSNKHSMGCHYRE